MPQRLFFLRIGGTLMGSLALLARQMGCQVAGFDDALYPPMSDLLGAADVDVHEGFDPRQLQPPPDLVVVGNARLPRGHPAIEHVLDNNLPYASGAAWLGDAVLRRRWPIAVAGTHGKTTTASMVAHILHQAGLAPGFLIGGVAGNFGASARLGTGRHFVVEADEYDTSYFDRRSKFVHYRPRTLVVNNLEHDHADIFDDLGQIQTQFHHLLRTVPGNGLVVAPAADANVEAVLAAGCWTPVARFGAGAEAAAAPAGEDSWTADAVAADGSGFAVCRNGEPLGEVRWPLLGEHNVANGLAAVAAAHHAGVEAGAAAAALCSFAGVKRRLELIAETLRLRVYDDFAHHPTAIATTLAGLRAHVGRERIVAVVEPRTHTMALGTFRPALAACCEGADEAIWFRGDNVRWDLGEVVRASAVPAAIETDLDRLIERILAFSGAGAAGRTHVVLLSNGAFGGIYQRLKERLAGAAHPAGAARPQGA